MIEQGPRENVISRIEDDLDSASNPRRRAVWLCFRHPDIENEVSDVAADRGIWAVRKTARRWRLAFTVAAALGAAVIACGGLAWQHGRSLAAEADIESSAGRAELLEVYAEKRAAMFSAAKVGEQVESRID